MKILLVEEDPAYKTALCTLFTPPQFSLTAVRSYGYALQLLTRTRFDLAIIEYCMGPLTADLLCREIRERSEDTGLILTCGCHNSANEKKIRSFSPLFYFIKPYETGELFSVTGQYAARKATLN